MRSFHGAPDRDAPQANQFTKDLADLRRGDEIAALSQRHFGGVIAMHRMRQCEGHVGLEAHRPVLGDRLADEIFERVHAGLFMPRPAGRRQARTIKTMPAAIKGSDKSMPMVAPPNRKPSCGSGSRKNSHANRAIP